MPDEIIQVGAIPRTRSGKKMQRPINKLLQGADPAMVLNRDAMAKAKCFGRSNAFAKRKKPRP